MLLQDYQIVTDQAADAVSAFAQVKLEGAVFHDTNGRKAWENIEDPVVPLERNSYGHPLAGLLRERQFEEVLFELGWEKETKLGMSCLFIEKKFFFFICLCG